MTTAALNNLLVYIQSMNLSARNRKWLASKILEPQADQVREEQEKYVRESLTRAMTEVREARRTGRKLQNAEELLEEMKSW